MKPNILFLFTDDQRFDTIHALGNDQIHTPNLDYLVRNGTAFTNAYIMGGTSPAVCMPSRAMMLTGRTLFHIDGRGEGIPAAHRILPEHFRQAGYETFGTGKWHNGPESYARSFDTGAQIFFGGMDDHWNVPACDFDPSGQYPPPRQAPICWLPGELSETKKRFDHIRRGKHSSELFADAACEFLLNHEPARPFFAYVSFMAPHDPRTMPQQYLTMYNPQDVRLPANFMPTHPFDNGALAIRDEKLAALPRKPAEIRRHLAEYYAMITHLDAQIGRILDALRASGQFEHTIIVLAGDNGLALGQHGLMGKQSNYDHSLHVPLLLMGPGIPAGQQRQAFCYLIDIFPTLCDLTGQPVPDSVEGVSLAPALSDGANHPRDQMHFAYCDLQNNTKHCTMMDKRYKLIEIRVGNNFIIQLFDLQNDPCEMHNLAGDPAYADERSRLSQELVHWRADMMNWHASQLT